MREIIFRGKRADNGEWVYGSLITERNMFDGNLMTMHIQDIEEPYDDNLIDDETVGQYTGMTDKNGKKIFAGDIISTSSKLIGAVEWNDTFAKYIVCYNQISGNWFDFEGEDCFSVALDCVIIGNIHDNPELLK